MTDQEMLQAHIDLIPYLATVLGPACEIVVHDVTNPAHSIVAIRNPLSGRDVGDPMTDLPLEQAAGSSFAANYIGRTKKGNFLSSTYYIKNEGRLIGLLCINKDMSNLQEASAALHILLEKFNLVAPQETAYKETLDSPITNMIYTRIADIIAQCGMPPKRMSQAERIQVVHQMKADGVLTMKGAVAEAASQLNVSIPTIYRYLNKPADE